MRRVDLRKISQNVYEVPIQAREGMHVPARVYADEALLEAMLPGDTLNQLANVATLPGVVGHVYGMPDMHEGYGFPVGGVAATAMPDGVVSPGGVGFDINCGVRLLKTPLCFEEFRKDAETFVHELSRCIPTGVGKGGILHFDDRDLDRVLAEGSPYLVRKLGYGFEADLEHTESGGCLPGANPAAVSQRARDRGRGQLGSMGSGNHFVETQYVDEIFDEAASAAMGIWKGQVAILIHSGSRGLGHQICTDYVREMDEMLADYGISLPDRQLSCAPASSPEGKRYLEAMGCAANFAWSNRQLIGHTVRKVICRLFKKKVKAEEVRVVYDVAHNIAKMERYDGKLVCVHRKGATRAFGSQHDEMPADYREIGQPLFIPGSMGTASYVMTGLPTSDSRSWGSSCHGAGRALSRTAAKKQVTGAELRRELQSRGIVVRCPTNQGLAEEAPFAYKDVERVAEVVESVGLARRVARLKPFGVIKG